MAKEDLIRSAINNLDESTAKDALALLLAGSSAAASHSSVSESAGKAADFANFAQAILWLKSKYKFQELNAFTTEADLVYVNTGDRRVLLTDNSVKPRTASQPKPAFADDDFENAYEPVNSSSKEREILPEPVQENSEKDENDPENAFEPVQKKGRFSNLEL